MKNLYKIIKMEDIYIGQKIPLFYLPVRCLPTKHALEVWVFPIAPLILIYRVIASIFQSVWTDLNEFILLQGFKYKGKNSKDKTNDTVR